LTGFPTPCQSAFGPHGPLSRAQLPTMRINIKSGLGVAAKKVVGLEWRSPDVSELVLECFYLPKLI
jgi:hypothetical protein